MVARAILIAVLGALILTGPVAQAEDEKKPADSPPPPTAAEAVANGHEDLAYPTAFATLTLTVPDARLSIFNRHPPKLPDRK